MFQRVHIAAVAGTLLIATSSWVSAAPITLDFEGLVDSVLVTNQFAGVTFSNAIALTAGMSLADADFPPFSGVTVVGDTSGAMSIAFATPVDSFGGYFTYSQALTLEAFNAGNLSLGSTSSAFSANFVSSGNPPNEFLSLLFPGLISRVTITANPFGDSFTLDDAQYVPAAPTTVPEPATLTLLLSGLAGSALARRRRNRAHF